MNFIITKINPEIKSLQAEQLISRYLQNKRRAHKMFDDDGFLYYEGLSKNNFLFDPLDGFGRNAGYTEIHYLENNKFIRL